jgi:DNA primase
MDIKEIKQRLSITQVLAHYGITAIRHKQICCPFHDDKTPSMQVFEERNSLYCHSSNCKHGGKHIDQIDFIMHQENITKHQAILKAKQLLNYIPNTKQATLTIQQHTNTNYNNSNNMQQQETNYNELFVRLQKTYVASRQAQDYAASRNINHVCLELGFNTAASKVVSGMRNCIVFPLRNNQGEIVSLYGRSIDPENPTHTGLHYYLKNRTGLYHNIPIAIGTETTTLVLTESIIDSATLMVHTNYHTLALFGTNGFTDEHKTLLQSLTNLEEIILFFDGDEAGKQAVAKHSGVLQQLVPGIKISNVITPDDEDINSLTISHEPTILNHLIQNRTFLFSPENKNNLTDNHTKNTTALSFDTTNEEYLCFTAGNIIYSIIGGVALYPIDKLKVTLGLQRNDSYNKLHRLRQSNLDLYSEEQLQRFIRTAAEKLELGTKQLNYDIAELIELLEDYRNQKINLGKPTVEPKRILTTFRIEELLKILRQPNLLRYINNLIGQTGIVGEEINRLIMWTVFTSRFMENPLHIICLGASGTGKTYLQERVSELFPAECKRSFTAASEQAFYYVGKTEIKNKIILVEDMDGASSVLYVLRELQSKAYVSKLVPIKDNKGNMQTKLLEVDGPIVLSGTTTKEKLYEDNANRCLLIYLDNSMEQQQGIMERQRNVSAGLINRAEEQRIIELLQDLQSMFKPINVVNPFATKLHIPETVFKPLRTNAHYLQFIEAITFIHQHQRPIKIDNQGLEYIETTLEDIELANELLKDVLLAKSDELTKACRDFLETVKAKLDQQKKSSFYKNDIREMMRINPNNLKHYLKTLQFYGYIRTIGGNKFKGGYEYEITNKHEYNELQNTVTSALDKALADIRKIA